MRKKVVIIGIGGASCSGKTLLAKHIRRALPSAVILHQDDFCPPAEQVPYSELYPDLQDWDDPPTCIQWDSFRQMMQHIHQHGVLPPHASHDHLNKQVEVNVDTTTQDKWKAAFSKLQDEARDQDEDLVWFIVDGFVLYWDQAIADLFDVRIFLRVPREILKRRRDERQVYVLQHPDDAAEGGVWVDPPNYFEKIVWPGYVKAHSAIFEGGDVEYGRVIPDNLAILSPLEGEEEMTRVFEASCTTVVDAVRKGAGCFIIDS